MKKNLVDIQWRPTPVPDIEWVRANLPKFLGNQRFTLFDQGTCVVWPQLHSLSQAECEDSLFSVAYNSPHFKVRLGKDEVYLVTFTGGVGGIVPKALLLQNFVNLRSAAFSHGLLPTESFRWDGDNEELEIDFVAGLYVRARLFSDVVAIKERRANNRGSDDFPTRPLP